MNGENAPAREPSGITTLDLLLFTAGFALGWVMHQGSALRTGQYYILPISRGPFHSLLGLDAAGWLWALVVALAFLIVGRRFRFDCTGRPAEWLAVALAIVLFESFYPAFRMERPGAMTGEPAWIAPPAATDSGYAIGTFLFPMSLPSDGPLLFDLWWKQAGETWAELWWITLRLTAAAILVAAVGWALRARLSTGWRTILMIVIAVLLVLGPLRLAEATSVEVTSCARKFDHQPGPSEHPRSWPWVVAHFDTRAWFGYSIRALVLTVAAMLAAKSLFSHGRRWLWTEWAAVVFASIIAGCWFYDEFFARPALDGTVRVALLVAWLLAIASIAAISIRLWRAIERRFERGPKKDGQFASLN
jgi:hypothetical protein